MSPRIGSLFSGYGGLDEAVTAVFSGSLVWVCDVDPAASKVLAQHHPGVPNLGDITAVDWDQVEPVDIIAGGSPCQDISAAGRRAGMKPGTRSGLWTSMANAIAALRPQLVVFENVRGILSAEAHCDLELGPWDLGGPGDGEPLLRALGRVLGDLADLGFDAEWTGLPASGIGAPHKRWREFLIAWPAADAQHEGRARGTGPAGVEGARPVGEPAGRGVGTAADPADLGRQRGGAAR